MAYRVVLDLSHVLPQIKHLKIELGVFGRSSLILDIDANDPDDACYTAFKEFCDIILEQVSNVEVKNLLKELKYDFIVAQMMEL